MNNLSYHSKSGHGIPSKQPQGNLPISSFPQWWEPRLRGPDCRKRLEEWFSLGRGHIRLPREGKVVSSPTPCHPLFPERIWLILWNPEERLRGNERSRYSRGELISKLARSLLVFQIILLVWNFCEQTPFSLIFRPVEWYLELEAILRDYLSQLISSRMKKQVQKDSVLLRY